MKALPWYGLEQQKILHTAQCPKDLWSLKDSGGSFSLDLNSSVSGKPDCFSSSKGVWVLRAGLANLLPSLCHSSPSAAALGNQTASGCATSCSEGGRHPSFHGIFDPFHGRLFLAGSFALKKFTYLKGGEEWEGLWIWDSQGKQNISSPSSWHLPKASLSLVPHSRIWSLSSVLLWEDVKTGRCGRRFCLLKWQLGLTWKENFKQASRLLSLPLFFVSDVQILVQREMCAENLHPSLPTSVAFGFLLLYVSCQSI